MKKNNMTARILAAALSVLMILSLIPLTAVETKAATKPTITTTILSMTGLTGSPFSDKIDATGDPAPTLTIVDGSLPGGMAMKADGTLYGTPVDFGSFTIRVQAKNSAGSDTKEFSFDVNPAQSGNAPYNVNLDVNGGNPLNPMMVVVPTRVNGYISSTSLPTPTRSGYNFAGWYTSATGGDRIEDSHYFTADTTLYAHWNNVAKTRNYTSLYGSNRYLTAVKVAKEAFPFGPGKGEVVIVYGNGFPDALSANAYAGIREAPILLSEREALRPEIKQLLQGEWKGAVQRITVIGLGFTEKFYNDLKSIDGISASSVRTIGGNNRYETAIKVCDAVLQAAKNIPLTISTVAVATGATAADAVSFSSWSYSQFIPIILVPAQGEKNYDAKMKMARDKISTFGMVDLLGAERVTPLACLSTNQKNNLYYRRLWGSNRYKTSQEIAKHFMQFTGTYNGACFADGTDAHYADALVGGVLAGSKHAPVVLTRRGLKDVGSYVSDYLSTTRTYDYTYYFIGWIGEGAASGDFPELLNAIKARD